MYKLTVSTAYESDYVVYFNTLDEVKEFVKEQRYAYDDITIEEILRTIDIYELMGS